MVVSAGVSGFLPPKSNLFALGEPDLECRYDLLGDPVPRRGLESISEPGRRGIRLERAVGPVSLILSVAILLVTGLFVSFFVTDNVILTGMKHERKLVEKTEKELEEEVQELREQTGGMRRESWELGHQADRPIYSTSFLGEENDHSTGDAVAA